MNKTIVLLAGLALAGAAFGKVNPTQPMVTGRGNVTVRPAKAIVANQTAADHSAQDQADALNKYLTATSVLKRPAAKPAKR